MSATTSSNPRRTGGDPVVSITEAEASGATAALFQDIREVLGVRVVNLIWRHLATFPGGLEWAWGAIRPLYVSGKVDAAAGILVADLSLPILPRMPPAALEALGLSVDDRAQIRRVMASYDRSNAMNLVALSALLVALGGERRHFEPIPPVTNRAPGLDGALPTLLSAADMAPETAQLVEMLNAIGEREHGIVASMYRQLAHWPGLLALLWTLVAPVHSDGRLFAAIDVNLAAARHLGCRLASDVSADRAALSPDALASVHAAVKTFVDQPIGKMVTVCRMISRAMPDEKQA